MFIKRLHQTFQTGAIEQKFVLKKYFQAFYLKLKAMLHLPVETGVKFNLNGFRSMAYPMNLHWMPRNRYV